MIEYKKKLKTKNILYVEDDLSILNEYSEIFGLFFNETFCVDSVEKALEHYEKNNIDIVLTDITLEDISGIELAKILKEKEPSLRVIALSGNSANYEKNADIFDKWILKPIDISELMEILSEDKK